MTLETLLILVILIVCLTYSFLGAVFDIADNYSEFNNLVEIAKKRKDKDQYIKNLVRDGKLHPLEVKYFKEKIGE